MPTKKRSLPKQIDNPKILKIPPQVKLGKKAAIQDPRTLRFKNYVPGAVAPALPDPPAEVSWVTKVPLPWGMLLNDQLGDCVPAALAHMVMQMTFFAGKPFIPTDAQVLAAYEKIGGYVPGDPSTDNGCFMLDALKYWRNNGFAGHKIAAFMQIDPLNPHEMRQAIQLFGGVLTGVQLPVSAQGKDDWTVPAGGPFMNGSPGTWGGHCVPIFASSPQTDTCVTWGQRLKMSHNFRIDYCDEMYAVVSSDFIDKAGVSPGGFNLQQLLTDLTLLS
jgi:hypothetical protein